jgi:hypothetical protein
LIKTQSDDLKDAFVVLAAAAADHHVPDHVDRDAPRERTTGTLERLTSVPLAKLDLLVGSGFAFAVRAAPHGTVTGFVGFALLDVHADGPAWGVVLLAIINALLGMVSVSARSPGPSFKRSSSCPQSCCPRSSFAG